MRFRPAANPVRGMAFTLIVMIVAAGAATADTVAATIKVDGDPRAVAVAADGKRVYISNGQSNSVSVIDTATNTVIDANGASPGSAIAVGPNPRDIAIGPDGSVYVATADDDSVSVIDPDGYEVETISVGSSPQGLAVSPDGTQLFVATSAETVSVIDTASRTVGTPIPVGGRVSDVAVTPDGKFVYVTNAGDDKVSVIDSAGRTVVATVGVASPAVVAANPNGTQVFVTNGSDVVSVIDADTHALTEFELPGGKPQGVAFTPDGSRAYVTQTPRDSVAVVDTEGLNVLAEFAVGDAPISASVTPEGTAAYVANRGDDTVSVLDVQITPTLTGDPTAGRVGEEYAFQFTTFGRHETTVSTNSALPDGLTLSPRGMLAGTPTGAGEFPLTVTASNGIDPVATLATTLIVDAPPTVLGTPVDGVAGEPYAFAFTVIGHPAATVTTSSRLPGGLRLSAAGVLAGTPTEPGTFPVAIIADNGVGRSDTHFTTLVVS